MRGIVQGVGFRANARAEAARHDLTGFARNLPDGGVELEVQGSEASVARMLAWLAEGPPWAEVESLEITDLEPRRSEGFRVI